MQHQPEIFCAALQLQRQGLTRVRPLLGGIQAWRAGNHPVAMLPVAPRVR